MFRVLVLAVFCIASILPAAESNAQNAFKVTCSAPPVLMHEVGMARPELMSNVFVQKSWVTRTKFTFDFGSARLHPWQVRSA